MCGIFGYSGKKTNAAQIVLDGLKRLDYRGYDSWGVAALSTGSLYTEKQVGKVTEISKSSKLRTLNSQLAIGHTRWATTGAVTQPNAHPHYSSDKTFALAQNGIVENYKDLQETLKKKGYAFTTQTDTEVIVRLIEDKMKSTRELRTAIRLAFRELKGRNTIILITSDKEIYAARNGSPLVVGMNDKTGEYYFSSDTLSFAPLADKALVVDNGQLIHLNGTLRLYELQKDQEVAYRFETMKLSTKTVDKKGFAHYMIKEIYDSPAVIRALTIQDELAYQKLASAIRRARRVYTIGSGTAGVAAAQIAFYLRHIAGIEAVSLVGADAKEYIDLLQETDLLIAPSQSGETADVLEVLEIAKQKGVSIASFVNMQGSLMTRMSEYKFMADAGPEIAVVSTKVFTSQITWGYLVAKTVAGEYKEGIRNLKKLADEAGNYLADQKNHKKLKRLAKHLSAAHDIFLLGKYQNFQIVKEGMVKIIEGSYKHAHAIPAGDLKHYAITLMQKGVPVIVAFSEDETKDDVINAVNEVRARGAEVTAIGPKTDESFDFFLKTPDTGETSAIINILPLQLLAYYLAIGLGNDIDKPRNIAKSVTVK